MLIKTTSKIIANKPDSDIIVVDKTNGDVILFNANRVNGLKVRASTKSSFMYQMDLHNLKEASHYVESEDTVANLKTYGDYTWNSNFIDLPIYPDNDATASTVTTSINCDSIALVVKDQQATATRSYVTYYEGGKKRRVLTSYSINQIYSLADDGNLTTS